MGSFAEQFQSLSQLSQDNGPGTGLASEAPHKAARAKRQVLPSGNETGLPTATLAETAAAHVSGVTLQAPPRSEQPPVADVPPRPATDENVAEQVASEALVPALALALATGPGPAPANAGVEASAPRVSPVMTGAPVQPPVLAGEREPPTPSNTVALALVEPAQALEPALASALHPPLSGATVSAAVPPPGAQAAVALPTGLSAAPEARDAVAALPVQLPEPATTAVADAVRSAGAASMVNVVKSDAAAPMRQRAAPPGPSPTRSFEAGVPPVTERAVESMRIDSLASAERLQALLVDAGQETVVVRQEAAAPLPVNAPVVVDARAQRADGVPAPGAPASDVFMAEADPAPEPAVDGMSPLLPPAEAEGLQMDLRLDGNGRALVIVRTNDDALGRSLRESTDQLQDALDDFGLRVEVDIRQGHDRSGASFSQRERGFHERPGAPAPAAGASRPDSPLPLPRVQASGLSLSVYA